MIISCLDRWLQLGIAAACLAVFLKTKNKELKEIAGPDVISALIGGVTEPAVYGVLLNSKAHGDRLPRPTVSAAPSAAFSMLPVMCRCRSTC